MHITYHGLSCFKIVAKKAGRGSDDVTIVFAPFDKSFGLRPPQAQTDLALIPHVDGMFANADVLRGNPIVVTTAGEYAVSGINIIGFDAPADPRGGLSRGNTSIFVLTIEDMKVVHLGALGTELTPDQMDFVVGADILFLPVGDKDGLDGKTAETIARKVEAKFIIPMQYKTKGLAASTIMDYKDFCSNIGNCPKSEEEKLIIKKEDVVEKVMEVRILKAI